jgi:hypothetical protein
MGLAITPIKAEPGESNPENTRKIKESAKTIEIEITTILNFFVRRKNRIIKSFL